MRTTRWKCFIVTLLSSITFNICADTIDNPCGGPAMLLNLVDRPTAADSACVVPFKNAILELGFEYSRSHYGNGDGQNFPQAELRIGLPASNEFVILLPNYFHQNLLPHSGFSATGVGIKHAIGYTEHWLAAAEAIFTLPDGSATFGSKSWGTAINGIVGYTFNPQFNLALMLGASTQTQSSRFGGQRFTSINPDLVFTYAPIAKINFYSEIYGQTKTGPGESSGFNFDAGILYLLLTNLTVDVEYGHRLSGDLAGFQDYFGAGMALMI